MAITVAIHQPEFMPWLGFCDKALHADLFVILDTVQFRRNYFQNRNKIRVADGWRWITIPVKHPVMVPIQDIGVDVESELQEKNIRLLTDAYQEAPFFNTYVAGLREVLVAKRTKLVDLNVTLIGVLFEALSISTPLIRASALGLPKGEGGTRVTLDICRAVGATTYLSGVSGREYLDLGLYEQAGIHVSFQGFRHPIYEQLHQPFLPCMSAVDLLFNVGPGSREILEGANVPRLDTVFQ